MLLARADDASMDAYLEIGYHPGADAQTLAGTILNDYGTIAAMEPLGQVKLGDLNAYGVNGATVQKQLEAYPDPDGGRLRFGRALPGRNGAGRLV